MSLSERIRTALEQALAQMADTGDLGSAGHAALAKGASWTVERPKRPEHGDLATNVAMLLAKPLGKAPRAIAEMIVAALADSSAIASAEIAGPGFINLRVSPAVFHASLEEILHAGETYGRTGGGAGERINLEFVSANPTGPLLVAHGRGAILGDAVARLLEATGHSVTREYYVNDFGNQVRIFADTVLAISEGRPIADEGYKGAYVEELSAWLKNVDPSVLSGDRAALERTCVTWMLRGIPGSKNLPGIKRTLADLGIFHDVWFSEESLHRWGHVAVALRQLEAGGYLVEKEGALFFTAKGEGEEDKDRVVRKSDGKYTYFASDIAYFTDKLERGYDRLITVLGADHHGYVARIRNVLGALGLAGDKFEALLFQLVFIYRDGEVVKSSKRAGNIVTVEEVAEEIDEAAGRKGAGRDALRFFFLSRSANSNIEFDIQLAKKNSLDNPVFYVQYGYARLCSLLRRAAEFGFIPKKSLSEKEWSALTHPDELSIAAKLSEFPALVQSAALAREPHKVVFYLQDLAREFQSYFTRLKGEGDPILPRASEREVPGWEKSWDFSKTRARLAWIESIRIVYAAGLSLIGVSAPDRMDRPASAVGSEITEDEVEN